MTSLITDSISVYYQCSEQQLWVEIFILKLFMLQIQNLINKNGHGRDRPYKKFFFLLLILKQEREFREWTLPSLLTSDLHACSLPLHGPCHFCGYAFISLPSRLCNMCLLLSVQPHVLIPASGMCLLFWYCIYKLWQKHSSCKPTFFLMLHCFLLFVQNNSIILSFPFLVINFSCGLPSISEYHFLPISWSRKNTYTHKWSFSTIVIYSSS